MKHKLNRSARKYIRKEKAKIRKTADQSIQGQKMVELYAKFGVKKSLRK